MSARISIDCYGEMKLKWFTKNEKELSLNDLIDKFSEHIKFHGMDAESYVPDPQDALTMPHLCYLLHEDIEFQPKPVVAHFCANAKLYNEYSMSNMQYSYKALLSILDNSLIKTIHHVFQKT